MLGLLGYARRESSRIGAGPSGKKRNKRNAGPAEFWSRGIANLFYIFFKTL
jgi:hypothetical protein